MGPQGRAVSLGQDTTAASETTFKILDGASSQPSAKQSDALIVKQKATVVRPIAVREPPLPHLAGALRLDPTQGLVPHDFTDLWCEKLAAHLPGTREWAFSEIFGWLNSAVFIAK